MWILFIKFIFAKLFDQWKTPFTLVTDFTYINSILVLLNTLIYISKKDPNWIEYPPPLAPPTPPVAKRGGGQFFFLDSQGKRSGVNEGKRQCEAGVVGELG